jgi:hypothetical protein
VKARGFMYITFGANNRGVNEVSGEVMRVSGGLMDRRQVKRRP